MGETRRESVIEDFEAPHQSFDTEAFNDGHDEALTSWYDTPCEFLPDCAEVSPYLPTIPETASAASSHIENEPERESSHTGIAIVIGIIVFLVIFILGMFCYTAIQKSNTIIEAANNINVLSYHKTEDSVDSRIVQLFEDPAYIEADTETRIALVQMVLDKAYEDGLLASKAEFEQGVFSFQYADGTLGGVDINDREDYLN